MFSMDRLRMQKIGGDHKAMKSSHSSSSIFQEKLFSPFLLLIFILVFLVVFHSNDYFYISRTQVGDNTPSNQPISLTAKEGVLAKMSSAVEEDSGREGCDIFTGWWVRDYTPPLYEESECPYLYPQLTCLEHGRPDKDFRYWRWQPRHCSLASFNATLMLESLRGKRMVFVGDSLGRGQFTSMVCLLRMSIPHETESMESRDSLTIFTAKGYNATVVFHWAPFLLESNADDPLRHRESDRLVRDGSIDGHGRHWREADILVFNSYKWWISGFRILRGSFEDEVKDIVAAPIEESYRMAIRTLIKWINYNVDPKKQRVFFTSMSPTHKRSELWGGVSDGNCYNETTIIEDQEFFGVDRSFMTTINDELGKSTVPITLINITGLSSARKDAHTSIYKKPWHPLTEEQLAYPKSYADCVHWCLPGLQDTWNQLLLSKLLYP